MTCSGRYGTLTHGTFSPPTIQFRPSWPGSVRRRKLSAALAHTELGGQRALLQDG
jgi:hypothetical protein